MSIKININQLTNQFDISITNTSINISLSNGVLSFSMPINNEITFDSINNNSINNSSLTSICGVTTYINNHLDKISTVNGKEIFLTYDVQPIINTNKTILSALNLISKLHNINKPLNGICMEAMVYHELNISDKHINECIDKCKISYNPVEDMHNYNSLSRVDNLIDLFISDPQFKDIYESISNKYFCIDSEAIECKTIKYRFDNTSDNYILQYILYLAAYAYNNSQRNGYNNDYNIIIDYCNEIINNLDSFEHLIKYISRVAQTIKQFGNICYADVPINKLSTKKNNISGNADLLIHSDEKSYKLIDIKCCQNNEYYINDKWPNQLMLYKLGLNQFNITNSYIFNVYTNEIISYELNEEVSIDDFE